MTGWGLECCISISIICFAPSMCGLPYGKDEAVFSSAIIGSKRLLHKQDIGIDNSFFLWLTHVTTTLELWLCCG